MDFEISGREEIRESVREFLENAPGVENMARRFEWPVDWDFYRAYCAWRNETFRGKDLPALRAMAEDLDRGGIELNPFGQTILVAATIGAVGSQEQKRDLLPRFLNGEILCALGYTEPDSGSDVAAARTRAVRDGDEWIIDGQKIFTSQADVATHIFVLARTNPDVPKHKGLTMFVVPVNSPGLEVRPLYTLAPHPTCMTYYSSVRVPDSMRVGEIDGGWATMRVALDLEHHGAAETSVVVAPGAPTGGLIEKAHDHAVEWATKTRDSNGRRIIDDPTVRSRLVRIAIDAEISSLLDYRNDPDLMKSGTGNGTKLFATEAYVRATNALMDIGGVDALIDEADPATIADGWIDYAFRDAPVRTIGAGASEIHRDVIAERRLGLPRTRPSGT
jgi:3-oxocholest-4-en-26-oyl-CoA dehydrogenase alpha subunit